MTREQRMEQTLKDIGRAAMAACTYPGAEGLNLDWVRAEVDAALENRKPQYSGHRTAYLRSPAPSVKSAADRMDKQSRRLIASGRVMLAD